MGNAPSVAELPPEWGDILPYITQEDIVCSSRNKCRLEEGNRVYLDGDIFDLPLYVPVALAVLRAHPQIKEVRFKLVPGRMTEEIFWAAFFGILNDGGIDVERLVGAIVDDYETGDEVDGSRETGEGEMLHSTVAQCSKAEGRPVKKENHKLTRSRTEHLEAHIARLQKSLREANHKTRNLAMELHKERNKHHGEATTEKFDASQTPKRSHKGCWVLDPDCSDFMKLDDELKENLRQEKAKRLNEVKSQMRFILDSDDIKDSYGKWSCCGKETYDTDC